MRNAVRLDANGYVCEFRQFESTPPKGWVDVGRQVVMFGQNKKKLVNGKVVDAGPIIEETYHLRRQNNYPPVGEQLDMLWHAMDQGQLPKIEPFYSKIRGVKQRFPKEVPS